MKTAVKFIASPLRPDRVAALALCFLFLVAAETHAQDDPLSCWNDGPAKQAIIRFVQDSTDKSGPARRRLSDPWPGYGRAHRHHLPGGGRDKFPPENKSDQRSI